MRRGEYGYDAPYAVVIFGALAVANAVGAAIFWREGETRVAAKMIALFVFFLFNTASFLYTTRRGKFVEWARILDRLRLRGDERVLDMGCGRGAVLTAGASRLTTGRATGIDVWSTRDQSGNDLVVSSLAIHNIRGNADRIRAVAEGVRVLKPGGRMEVLVGQPVRRHQPRDRIEAASLNGSAARDTLDVHEEVTCRAVSS